jgi:hypothetical protein
MKKRISCQSMLVFFIRCSNLNLSSIKQVYACLYFQLIKYKESHVMVTTNNLKLPITYIGKTTITFHYNFDKVHLQDVYHVWVYMKKKDLLFITQLISTCYYVLFGSHDVS